VKINTKSELAINGILAIAKSDGKRPLSLAVLSKNMGISLSYLEQVFSSLKKSGLVRGVRGPGGGYKLSKSPEMITMDEVISSTETRVDEYSKNVLRMSNDIRILDFLKIIESKTLKLYSNFTLQDLIDENFISEQENREVPPQAAE